MKGVALNLTRSPENAVFWECSDPFLWGVGQAASTLETRTKPTPRGLRQHRAAQQQVSNQASDDQGLLGKSAMEVPEYLNRCKRRFREGRVASDGDR